MKRGTSLRAGPYLKTPDQYVLICADKAFDLQVSAYGISESDLSFLLEMCKKYVAELNLCGSPTEKGGKCL